MHERTAQLAALTVSLVAHGALMTGLPASGLAPEGTSVSGSRVVEVSFQRAAAAPAGETLPDPEPVASLVPETAAMPAPDASDPTQPPDAETRAAPPTIAAVVGPGAVAPLPPESEITKNPPIESGNASRSVPEPARSNPAPSAAEDEPPAAESPPDSSPAKPATASRPATARGSSSSGERERYLAELLAHIEASKYYPRSARRLRLEGGVEVTFRLFEDGRIGEVALGSGPELLRAAARRTLERAAPMPPPPPSITNPLPVRYVMRYRLR